MTAQNRDHARVLLDAARRDLRALGGMDDRATFADEIAGFHAQQGVEKALKAWLVVRGVEYPLTHDLDALLDLVEGAGGTAAPFRPLGTLSAYAVRFRYESLDAVGGPPLDRAAVVAEVAALLDHVARVVDEPEP